MLIKKLDECKEIIAGDGSKLSELLHPAGDNLNIKYSLAHARVEPGETTLAHRLKSSEVYYMISGYGTMFIDGEKEAVSVGSTVFIPSGSVQKIENTGPDDLIFICIVEPAWKPEDEDVLEGERHG